MTFPASFNVTSLNGKNGFAFINDLGGFWFGEISLNVRDINNDGKSDLIVGSQYINQAYVLFGANSFPSRVYTSSLNGANGFRIIGDSQTTAIGCAAAGIGDVNDDGIDDFIVGSCFDAPQAYAYVMFGANSFPSRVSVANLDGKNGFKIVGHIGQGFGNAGGIGDINGDGKKDFILAKTGQNPDYNVAFIIYGASQFPAALALLSLDGNNGFTVVGPSMNFFEAWVAGVGDFNGDTKPDFAATMGWIGQTAVIFGGDKFPAVVHTSNLNGTNGFIIKSVFGAWVEVAGVGDVNGDYLPDLGISRANANEAFLIFGGKHFNATFDVSSLNGSNGAKLIGPPNDVFFGANMAEISAMHNNKSGVIVGAPAAGSTRGDGNAFVFFNMTHFPPEIHASDLNGTNGFKIVGPHNAQLGYSVAGIDNFSGAGDTTIVVGAPFINATYIILDVPMV